MRAHHQDSEEEENRICKVLVCGVCTWFPSQIIESLSNEPVLDPAEVCSAKDLKKEQHNSC